MNAIWIAAALFAVIMIGLVVWVLVQNTQDQRKMSSLKRR